MKSIFASRSLHRLCILLVGISALSVSSLYLGKWVVAFQGATSSLVFLQNGTLVYNTYANQGESNSVNRIPDFSFCGYKGGGVAIPFIDVKRTISPVSGDNTLNIQNAIDFVSGLPLDANGFRGAVFLNAGAYNVNSPIFIRTSGVALRGAGQGTNGAIIRATAAQSYIVVNVGVDPEPSGATPEVSGTNRPITTTYVATGARSFNVSTTSGYAVGDKILVVRTPNQAWIDALNMAQFGWTPSAYVVKYERKITAISGNTVTIDVPLVQTITSNYGGGYIAKYTATRINNCGVEDIRFDSVFSGPEDENHAGDAVRFAFVEDSWVRNITAVHFHHAAVTISDSTVRCTVQDSACKDMISIVTGGRRYPFQIEGQASYNLIQRCYTEDARHDFATGSRVPGPNVFLDNYGRDSNTDSGPHHRYATGELYDNVLARELKVRNRGASGTGHGWSGAQQVFWNCETRSASNPGNDTIHVDSPPGARNFGIGCDGTNQLGAGFYEDFGTPVTPRSLYLQQLKDRLGQAAVDNITAAQQQAGSVWTVLFNWAGEGRSPLANTGPQQPGCATATSGGSWQNRSFANQTGTFTAEFDATPSAFPINSVVGLSQGAQTAYTGFAAIARFNPDGNIDARNGGVFAAAGAIPYSANVTYHFRMVVNTPARTYSIFVRPEGGSELTIGSNFAFRTEQNTVTSLNNWGIFVNASSPGSTTACDFTISTGPTCVTATAGGSWQNRSFTSQSGTFTAEFDATPLVAPTDTVVGLSQGAQTAYSGFATLARFNLTGAIDARNGGAYAAATAIPYSANVTYHFRMVVNVPAHTYSIFVRPAGGSELTIGTDFAFRTEQNTVTSLNNWGGFVNTSATGSSRVCNFMINGGLAAIPMRGERRYKRGGVARSSLLAHSYTRTK
ncbi:MAG TPA: hypothetical protein VJ810_02945 [Blastocatellia bacterium]|nr:hypothetical protein [Blastocatellia bacterium]